MTEAQGGVVEGGGLGGGGKRKEEGGVKECTGEFGLEQGCVCCSCEWGRQECSLGTPAPP